MNGEQITTGRPLDGGAPTDGPALRLDPSGPAAELLRESPRPLVSSPGSGLWATLLTRPSADDTDRPELLQWLRPDAPAPPPHYHPTPETFRAVEGELTLLLDDSPRTLTPGEEVTVPADTPHAFRNDTDETISFVGYPPSMLTVRALYSVWGLDHEGAFGSDGEYGEPGPLYGLVAADTLRGETTVTTPPVPLQRLLGVTVVPFARRLGYDVVDGYYLEDSFWERHVEQPEW